MNSHSENHLNHHHRPSNRDLKYHGSLRGLNKTKLMYDIKKEQSKTFRHEIDLIKHKKDSESASSSKEKKNNKN